MIQFDEMEFEGMTRISIQGMPFGLSKRTVLLGYKKNLTNLEIGKYLPNGVIQKASKEVVKEIIAPGSPCEVLKKLSV